MELVEAQDHGELPVCRNCGAPVAEKFCTVCGEKIFTPGEHSLGHFVGDVVNELTFLDSKLLRTLKLMLTRPGALSYQYVNGKRVRFIKPLSMFFMANLVYFLFPLYNALDSELNNQIKHLPHSAIVASMVEDRIERDNIKYEVFETEYNQQSTNMAKLVLIIFVLYFSIPLAIVNASRKLYYYDHLMICLELFSLVVLIVFVGIPWLIYFIAWLVALSGGNIWFITNDAFSSWPLGIALAYLLFRIEKEAYGRKTLSALALAVVLVFVFFVTLQVYRGSLFFITFWTM